MIEVLQSWTIGGVMWHQLPELFMPSLSYSHLVVQLQFKRRACEKHRVVVINLCHDANKPKKEFNSFELVRRFCSALTFWPCLVSYFFLLEALYFPYFTFVLWFLFFS